MSEVEDPGRWRSIDVGGTGLDVWEAGVAAPGAAPPGAPASGEDPVVVVGTALTADELLPVARRLAAEPGRRIVAYRRRGYGSGGTTTGAGSIRLDAADLVALLDALGIARATLIGVSYSAAVVLQAAADRPDRAARVAAIEPPPIQARSAAAFRVACTRLAGEFDALGGRRTADRFLSRLMDPHWRLDLERLLPGSVAQVEEDASTFFLADIPALLAWEYSARDAARVTAPVLLVSGTASAHWFADEIEAIRGWFRNVAHVSVANADHSMALTHPDTIAQILEMFLNEPVSD
ncbi:alpha/beta fold hydrolase [Demequina phytophila]|uniref:alpha/beta fold hydrolase n=1 Tax=Demequina phytophila TaxID=1638981 RepID=UPI00078058BA|nr:alpha/beta hydrolase [Demequina phytophila]